MGMTSSIIAIGPFSKNITDVLEYGEKAYENTKEGVMITEWLFGIHQGPSTSREFASLLGISDPRDFNQHHIKKENIDMRGLEKFSKQYGYESDFIALLKLKDGGFEFHFRPEG